MIMYTPSPRQVALDSSQKWIVRTVELIPTQRRSPPFWQRGPWAPALTPRAASRLVLATLVLFCVCSDSFWKAWATRRSMQAGYGEGLLLLQGPGGGSAAAVAANGEMLPWRRQKGARKAGPLEVLLPDSLGSNASRQQQGGTADSSAEVAALATGASSMRVDKRQMLKAAAPTFEGSRRRHGKHSDSWEGSLEDSQAVTGSA